MCLSITSAPAPPGALRQAGHGTESRLKRLSKGDRIVFYSPRPDQRFTAIAEVVDDAPYQAEDGAWRRRVEFVDIVEAPIQPLIESLDFISDKRQWGWIFRRGFFEIGETDFQRIATALSEESSLLAAAPSR